MTVLGSKRVPRVAKLGHSVEKHLLGFAITKIILVHQAVLHSRMAPTAGKNHLIWPRPALTHVALYSNYNIRLR